MSDDLQIPTNRPEDFLAEQPIKDYVVSSFPISPPIDETEMSSKNDDAASLAPPQKEDVCLVPQLNNVADNKSLPKENDSPVTPPKEGVTPAPPQMNDTDHTAGRSSLPSNKDIALEPKVKIEYSEANSNEATNSNGNSDLIKQEIKQETIDLGYDTYYYDVVDKQIPVKNEKIEPKVGFDRGLEPSHIVGATKLNGKLMFLIAWKNSNAADLLESTVVYKKCPQLAIQFFEARLTYCPYDEEDN